MKKLIILILIFTLMLAVTVYADDTNPGGGGFSITGIIDAITNLPNEFIKTINDSVYGFLKTVLTEIYVYIVDNYINSMLSVLPDSLKNTPALWSNSSPTVVNVIIDALKPICITLATIGFIINLGKAMAGMVSYGRTVTRCFIRLILTVILIGYSGQLLQWIIDFNDSFIQFIDGRIATDIISAFKDAIVDKSIIQASTATLSAVLLVQFTAWIIWIAALCVQFVLLFRIIQLMFYMLISPLVFTCNVIEETTDIVKSYMRKFVSVVLKSFFYNLVFLVYITAITLPNSVPVGVIGKALCIIILVISLFKIPKEFEELLGIGRTQNFNMGYLLTALGSVIAAVI